MNSALPPGSLPHEPLTPLFATLTNRPQLPENPTALSPFLATHTDFSPVSPVFATHTKTTGVSHGSRQAFLKFYLNFPSLITSLARSLHKERFTTRFASERSALFPKTAGCHTNSSQEETHRHPLTAILSSRDEKPVTISPLESAFTKRDTRNSFGMCIYKNCRVALPLLIKNLKSYLSCILPLRERHIARVSAGCMVEFTQDSSSLCLRRKYAL
jgi:hypothetical protein